MSNSTLVVFWGCFWCCNFPVCTPHDNSHNTDGYLKSPASKCRICGSIPYNSQIAMNSTFSLHFTLFQQCKMRLIFSILPEVEIRYIRDMWQHKYKILRIVWLNIFDQPQEYRPWDVITRIIFGPQNSHRALKSESLAQRTIKTGWIKCIQLEWIIGCTANV